MRKEWLFHSMRNQYITTWPFYLQVFKEDGDWLLRECLAVIKLISILLMINLNLVNYLKSYQRCLYLKRKKKLHYTTNFSYKIKILFQNQRNLDLKICGLYLDTPFCSMINVKYFFKDNSFIVLHNFILLLHL